MKNILNSAIASKFNSDTQSYVELKSEKADEESNILLDIKKDHDQMNTKESMESNISPSKHVANQSKLFRPPESPSAKTEERLLSPQNPLMSPIGPHFPSSSMFFPHPYVHLGSMHPLGLPIVHQIPMAMQQYLPSSVQNAAKQNHRPNILRNSPSTSKPMPISSALHEHDKMAANALFQQPAHSHRNSLNVPLHGKSPAAHSNHKRSHDSLYSPNYNIPSHPKSLSNKSLLFDYEAPKRIKTESDLNTDSVVKQSKADDDQPQDLSMKTLCKKTESRLDNNGLDLRQTSTTQSVDNTMKSMKSEMTLNLPKHSMSNILKTPSFSRRSSPLDVFSSKSPVFSAAPSHSSTKVCFIAKCFCHRSQET